MTSGMTTYELMLALSVVPANTLVCMPDCMPITGVYLEGNVIYLSDDEGISDE